MSRFTLLAIFAALAALGISILLGFMGGATVALPSLFDRLVALAALLLGVGVAASAWWDYGRRDGVGVVSSSAAALLVLSVLRSIAMPGIEFPPLFNALHLAAALLATASFLSAAMLSLVANGALHIPARRGAAGRDTYPRLVLLTTSGVFLLAVLTPFSGATHAGAPTILQGINWALMTIVGIFVGLTLYESYHKRPGTAHVTVAWGAVALFAAFAVLSLFPGDLLGLPRLLQAAAGSLLFALSALLSLIAYVLPAPRPVSLRRAPVNQSAPTSTAVNAVTTPSGPTTFTPVSSAGAPAAALVLPQPDVTARSLRSTIGVYVTLTKPRIIVLLLITTWAAMWIAAPTPPSAWLVLWTMVGGYLAAGGANAINMYMDRDIDRLMGRTARRPLPSQQLEPQKALWFGVTLGVLSFAVLAAFVNMLSAVLSILGLLLYVLLYTGWLKRTTTQNIVIGGAAGAIPPLVGWAAVSGDISLAAIWLFVIIFYWTPPHFWTLALVRQADYARAGVPMLPVVKGEAETRRQIFLYSILLVALSVMLVPLRAMGLVYLTLALGFGGLFVWYAYKLMREHSQAAAWRLYKYSLLYLALIFAAMVLDHVLLWGLPSTLVTILWS